MIMYFRISIFFFIIIILAYFLLRSFLAYDIINFTPYLLQVIPEASIVGNNSKQNKAKLMINK